MQPVLITLLSALVFFIMGYYFGHQIGSTRHIREQLARTRSRQQD